MVRLLGRVLVRSVSKLILNWLSVISPSSDATDLVLMGLEDLDVARDVALEVALEMGLLYPGSPKSNIILYYISIFVRYEYHAALQSF